MNANAVMLWLVVGVSAAGMAWAGNAPAPAASSNTAPTDADGSAKSSTKAAAPASGDSDSAGKATLASWLDLLAAQRVSEVIGTAVNASIRDRPVLLSGWEDYVRAVDSGRLVQAQIDHSKTIISGYSGLLAAATNKSKANDCGGETPPPNILGNTSSEQSLGLPPATKGLLPSGFNPSLAELQAISGAIKGISDIVRPSVSEPSLGPVGLTNVDLYLASASPSRKIYVTPVIAQDSNTMTATVRRSLDLARQMTALATKLGDRAECKTLVGNLTQSATKLGNLAEALQPEPASGTSASGTSAAAEALAEFALTQQYHDLTILDIQLISEDATDRSYSNLIPTSKRLMQSSVLAGYRLLDGTTGQILLSGTVAVFCQVVAREGVLGAEAFGNKVSSADMCSTIP